VKSEKRKVKNMKFESWVSFIEQNGEDRTSYGVALLDCLVADMNQQLFVSKYLLGLPKKDLLEAFLEKEVEVWK
jgi:hypothetical protein